MRIPRLGGAAIAVAMLLSVESAAANEEYSRPAHHPHHVGVHGKHAGAKQGRKRPDRRDALIRNLQRRVKRLEQNALRAPDSMIPDARLDALRQAGQQTASAAPPDETFVSEPAAPPPAVVQTAQSAAPGQFVVSPEAAQHALERALVQSGALLLRPGEVEFVPSGTYQVTEFTRPDQLVLGPSGNVFVATDALRSTLVQSQALARVGLPWEAQLEVALSYDFASSSNTTQVVGANLVRHATTGSGLGDSSVTLIKQVTSEGAWLPGIFVSGTGNIGQMDNGLPLGTGFDWFRAAVVAVKRQDPLVFTAGLAYQTSLARDGILPGDEIIPSVGMLFAVSPETSLQFVQQLAFVNNTRFRGVTVPGTSQIQGVFQAGVLSILAPGVVVNLTAAISETPDAPDLTVQLSVPIRLN
jgi:hypothetical protein